jgi:hypothetical protein
MDARQSNTGKIGHREKYQGKIAMREKMARICWPTVQTLSNADRREITGK